MPTVRDAVAAHLRAPAVAATGVAAFVLVSAGDVVMAAAGSSVEHFDGEGVSSIVMEVEEVALLDPMRVDELLPAAVQIHDAVIIQEHFNFPVAPTACLPYLEYARGRRMEKLRELGGRRCLFIASLPMIGRKNSKSRM